MATKENTIQLHVKRIERLENELTRLKESTDKETKELEDTLITQVGLHTFLRTNVFFF